MGRRKIEDIPPSAAEIEMDEEMEREMNNYYYEDNISVIINDIHKRLDKLEKRNNEK